MLRGAGGGGGEVVALTPVTPSLVDGGLLLLVGLVVLVFWSPIVNLQSDGELATAVVTMTSSNFLQLARTH